MSKIIEVGETENEVNVSYYYKGESDFSSRWYCNVNLPNTVKKFMSEATRTDYGWVVMYNKDKMIHDGKIVDFDMDLLNKMWGEETK